MLSTKFPQVVTHRRHSLSVLRKDQPLPISDVSVDLLSEDPRNLGHSDSADRDAQVSDNASRVAQQGWMNR